MGLCIRRRKKIIIVLRPRIMSRLFCPNSNIYSKRIKILVSFTDFFVYNTYFNHT
uniref:Uncharacterized protein n=1 Tax=Anguilla anguilla TaxID=7936 RepID=A0A0E9RVK2_ANGAN